MKLIPTPCRWEGWLIIIELVLLDKILFVPLEFTIDGIHILDELEFVVGKICIKEPKWAMRSRELMNNLCTECYFKSLDSLEHQVSQFCIKFIQSNSIFKATVWLELMSCLISLHWTEILNKTKITDLAKELCCLRLVSYLKSSVFQKSNLVSDG